MADSAITAQAEAALAAGKKPPVLGRPADLAQARKVAQDFEAFFLGQMLQPMFANIDLAEPFGGGAAEKMWRSLQVDEYGKALARAGGIGIADAVFKEILRTQEVK